MLNFYLSLVETDEQRSFIEVFYAQNKTNMVGFVCNIVKNQELAADIVHDTMLKIVDGVDFFMGLRDTSTAYAYRMLENAAKGHFRKKSTRTTVSLHDLGEERFATPDSTEVVALKNMSLHDVKEAAKKIPLNQYEVFTLSCIGLSHRDIASMLGITETNSQTRLNRAVQNIRKILEKGDAKHGND